MKTIKAPLRVAFALLCLSGIAFASQHEPINTIPAHSGSSYQAKLIMEK